nr:biotin--[acetyl-CoA-carboxylase] ligase [Gryllotalpicola ginsengisoli]
MKAEEMVRTRRIASRLVVKERTGSTNSDLVEAASTDASGWPHLAVIATDEQTAGRGRLGRQWQAPAGTSLAASVLVRPAALPGALPADAYGWLPLLAGVAMARAIRSALADTDAGADAEPDAETDAATETAAPADRVELKWPNDVLIGGRKVCGILAELLPGGDGAVIGCGVNLTIDRADLPVETATSLRLEGAPHPDADALLAAYLEGLQVLLYELANAGGDAEACGIRAVVERECSTIGREVRVELPGGAPLTGRAGGLDAAGRLVVVTDAGSRAVAAGDVTHLRY